jgi:hypothetical protein
LRKTTKFFSQEAGLRTEVRNRNMPTRRKNDGYLTDMFGDAAKCADQRYGAVQAVNAMDYDRRWLVSVRLWTVLTAKGEG